MTHAYARFRVQGTDLADLEANAWAEIVRLAGPARAEPVDYDLESITRPLGDDASESERWTATVSCDLAATLKAPPTKPVLIADVANQLAGAGVVTSIPHGSAILGWLAAHGYLTAVTAT